MSEFKFKRADDGGWHVFLSGRSTDDWGIAGNELDGVTKREAAQKLEDFIIEAMEALRALNEGRED